MHCCGNPIHDVMTNIALALPFLASFGMWLRTLNTRRKRRPPTGRTS